VTYVSICSHDRHWIQIYAHAWGTILNKYLCLKFCHLHFQGYQPLRLSLPTHLLRRPLFPGSSESDQFRDRKWLGWMGTDAVSVTSGCAEMGSKAFQSYGSIENQGTLGVPGCHVSWPIPECRMSSKCSKCLKQTCEKIGWCSNLPGLYHLVSLCPNAAIIRYIFSTFQVVTCFLVNADLEG
jgi:hypothetical protein